MSVRIARSREATGLDFAAHVFASQEYLSARSSDFGWVVSDNYVLPFFCDRSLVFRRLVFTDVPIARPRAGDGSSIDEKVFLDDAIGAIRRAAICDFISRPQTNSVFDVQPSAGLSVPWGTYETKIDRSDSEMLESFHVKHRNMVSKAQRGDVEIAPIDNMATIYSSLRDTMTRQGLLQFPSLQFLDRLFNGLPIRPLSLGAFKDRQLQGVAFVPFDLEKGYYLYGGSIAQPYGGAMNLLQFEVMRRLRDKGVKTYDFVGARIDVQKGSKYEGMQRFKSRFGATLRTGWTFRVVFSDTKFRLFNRLADVRFRMNGGRYHDPIDQLVAGHGE